MKTERFVIAKDRKEIVRLEVKPGKYKQVLSLPLAQKYIADLRREQPITDFDIYKLCPVGKEKGV